MCVESGERILGFKSYIYTFNTWVVRKVRSDFCSVALEKVWIYLNDWKQMTCVHIVKDGTSGLFGKKVWLWYVIFYQFYTPLNMEENKVHFRHLILFFYRKGENVTHAVNEICAVYGEGAVTDRTVRKWFTRLKAGDFILKFQERSGRPSTTDED